MSQNWRIYSLSDSTLFTFFSLAEATSLPHIVRKGQLPTATAQNQATDSASFLLGPLLGGMLYGLGQAVPFLLDAISYTCSVLGLLFMRAKLQEERTEVPKKMWSEVGEGINWLWHDSVLRFLALLTCGLMTPVAGYTLILVTLTQSFHTSSFVIGTILTGSGIGSITGSLLANPVQKRFPFGQVITWSAWIWAISWLALAAAFDPLLLGLATVVNSIIAPVYLSSLFSYRLMSIPDHLQGRVLSVFRLLSFGCQPLVLLWRFPKDELCNEHQTLP